MKIVIALMWLVIVSAVFGQAPIQRNTWTTNSNPVFKGNSNVVYSNINSTVTYEFYGDPLSNSNRVVRSGDINLLSTNGVAVAAEHGIGVTTNFTGGKTVYGVIATQWTNDLGQAYLSSSVAVITDPAVKRAAGLYARFRATALTNGQGTFVTNWVDDFGNVTLTNTGINAPLMSTGFSGHTGVRFYGTNWLRTTALPASLNTNSAIFMVIEGTNTPGADRYFLSGSSSHWFWGNGGSGAFLNNFRIWWNASGAGTPNVADLNFPHSTGLVQTAILGTSFAGDTNQTSAVEIRRNFNELFREQTYYTNGWLSLLDSSRLYIGTPSWAPGNSGLSFQGLIKEFLIFTNALSTEVYSNTVMMLKKVYAEPTAGFYFADGDAGFVGGGMLDPQKGYASVMHQVDRFLPAHKGNISANTVRTAANILTETTNVVSGTLQQRYSPARPYNLYFLYFGTQWIYLGTNATDLWNVTSNAYQGALRTGWTVPVLTLLPNGETNGQREIYNELVRNNWQKIGTHMIDLTTLAEADHAEDFTNQNHYISTGNGYMPQGKLSSDITARIFDVLGGNFVAPIK